MTVNHSSIVGPKIVADEARALALDQEQPDQDQDADGHDESVRVVARRFLVLPPRSIPRSPA